MTCPSESARAVKRPAETVPRMSQPLSASCLISSNVAPGCPARARASATRFTDVVDPDYGLAGEYAALLELHPQHPQQVVRGVPGDAHDRSGDGELLEEVGDRPEDRGPGPVVGSLVRCGTDEHEVRPVGDGERGDLHGAIVRGDGCGPSPSPTVVAVSPWEDRVRGPRDRAAGL